MKRGPSYALGDKTAADGRFEQRIAGKSISAMEARARGLTASPETFDRCTPGKIDRDAAHVVMRRRADWNRLGDRIDSGGVAKAGDRRKAARKIEVRHVPRVEKNPVARRQVPPDRARDNIARCKLGAGHADHEAMASLVDEDRPFAAHGLADELKRRRNAIERGRMKLDKFEIGHGHARLRREGQPFTPRSSRISAMLEQAADAASRDDGALRSENHRSASAFGDNSCHGVIFDEQPPRRETFDHGDGGRFARKTGQGPHDFASAAIAAGMNDPPARMRGFEAKNKFAFAVAIERHAAPDQFADRCRRGFEDRPRDKLVAKAVAGLERIGEMQRKIVVRPKARGDPALCEDAR